MEDNINIANMTMTSKSKKAKGSRFEQFIAEQIRESGLDLNARRQPLSGAGYDKGDIKTTIPFTIECKNCNQVYAMEWIEQSKREALQGNVNPDKWAVVFRNPKLAEGQESFVIISLDQFLELLKGKQENLIIEVDADNRQLKYDLQRLKEALNKVIKQLD